MRTTAHRPWNATRALCGTMAFVALGATAVMTWTPISPGRAQGITPTYYVDVQPILEKHCVSCHIAGGIAPFPLESGEQAVKWANAIAGVTASGYMPPWPPGGDSPAFLDDRRLGSASKQILQDWAKAGAPLGRRGANQKP